MPKPLEALLRPPLEWYSCVFAFCLMVILNKWPNLLLVPSSWLSVINVFFSVFIAWRGYQGWMVCSYQCHLRRWPDYRLRSSKIPKKPQHLFLGKGFLWTTQLTQRLRNLDFPFNAHYLRQNTSGGPQLHGVSMREKPVFMNLADRAQHMLVLGTTGVGKTRFAELVISQDIHRGDVVIVLDPKGDVALLKRVLQEAKSAHRSEQVRILHLGFPHLSCRYNPIGFFTKVTQVATRIANALPSTGEAAAFREFAWKYVHLVTRGLVALNIKPTYRVIHYYITKLDQLFIQVAQTQFEQDACLAKAFQQFVEVNKKNASYLEKLVTLMEYHFRKQGHDAILANSHWQLLNDLLTACRMDRVYYDKITASVGPLLEKLTSGDIAELLSPDEHTDDSRPIIDWLSVIKHKQIVYIGMDALTDTMIASTVGNALLADLVATAGYLYKYEKDFPSIQVHADEFNEVIGDEFVPLLNKARAAGFHITAYTQTWSDVEARLVSKAKASQVAGNLGSVIMFRCKDANTVDMLLNQLPKVPILRATPGSTSSDQADSNEGVYFHSNNEDRLNYQDMPLLNQSDMLNLPKGHAFALLNGGKLYKLRMPLLTEDNHQDNVEALLKAWTYF